MPVGIVARGSKTIVRWFQREDVDKRQQWPKHTDPLYSHNDPRPMSARERDLWFLEHTMSASHRMFAIDDLRGNMIGWITLRCVDMDSGSSVLGIALDPTKMGMGYGTDALKAFLGYYFGTMGLRLLRLDVAAFNLRAMRCYEKCGFRYVGQHWKEHPASAFPPIFSDPRYKDVSRYFRQTLLGVEVLYRDMVIDRISFFRQEGALHSAGQVDGQRKNHNARRIAQR